MIINDVQFNVELEQIISDLQAELQNQNILLLQKTTETSSDIMVQCPYHGDGQERRPSAGIRKSDGLFHCFACNEIHSLSEVISHCFGHYEDTLGTFGWKWLLRNYSTVTVESRKDIELDYGRNSKKIEQCEYVSEEELDRYRYIHPYMYKRRLIDEIIELFDIGYDKETKCITFPVRDEKGRCLFVARRSVNTKYFNYPTGVTKPLYGLYEYKRVTSQIRKGVMFMQVPPELLQKAEEVIICESMLDALTAWVYGKFAVALNGLGNELQFKQLRELQCRKLILATDNDEAGMKARKRIRKNVRNKLITEYTLPEGKKDLNELEYTEFTSLQESF